MLHIIRQILVFGSLGAALFASAGCAPKPIAPMTVQDLMDDRVTLDGVLLKCNQHLKPQTDTDCQNARIAVERLAQNVDPADEAKRQAEFEQQREKLRSSQDKARQAHEAATKVDAYNLPLVPVDGAPPSGDAAVPAGAASPPGSVSPGAVKP